MTKPTKISLPRKCQDSIRSARWHRNRSYLPFLMSMGLLLLGAVTALLMHPERAFEEGR